jgi:hypothetical protein
MAQSAINGAIELDVRQILDERDPRENSGLYHLADQLLRTKRSTIRPLPSQTFLASIRTRPSICERSPMATFAA